ncbi:tRNA 2-thiocytidine biosynthesis protein TtcA [Methylophilus rhizosphaerae]|uniref:tRNA-cytidine(32) 2-sulfurtransferase n=1 Tax=Methylophilus rhizosphaerae TaxID=492660 RepID=A0A1G9DTC1_9PROT|nr:tRNA 2-thiocytidine(32) synthetase TtcA [Methylophilus rhizosphaerae]SDK67060.1 tRNA 2-thiocytidine biosynthesis protein TtcA [Methylophilus rhizosphaerae]
MKTKHYPDDVSQNFLKLRNQLISATGKAIGDYNMIEDGDTVLVCMSGGKDSHAMLMILLALQERAPINFKLIAMNLDQKQPGFPADILPAYLEKLGVEYRIVEADTYSIVKEKIPEGKTTCSLCSRLRRGIIYTTAQQLGANKIALGHHRDDIVQTLFLNMFYGAKMKAMPPKLATNRGEFMVIRPLAYCAEKDIAAYARGMQFPIIPCDLCGSQENLQRQKIKDMLNNWEREQPGRINNIFRAIGNVEPSHLADVDLYDFKHLSQAREEDEDPMFDHEKLPANDMALTIATQDDKRIEFARKPFPVAVATEE